MNQCTNKIYGYIYIYEKRHNIAAQAKRITKEYDDAHIYKETYIGTDINKRIAFKKLLNKLESNDTVVFSDIFCLSPISNEAINLYYKLLDSGVNIIFLRDPALNSASFFKAFSKVYPDNLCNSNEFREFSRLFIKEKVATDIKALLIANNKRLAELSGAIKSSQQKAKKKKKKPGWKKGRKRSNRNEAKILKDIRHLSKYFEGVLSDTQCAKLVGISRPTFYKYRDLLIEQEKNNELS